MSGFIEIINESGILRQGMFYGRGPVGGSEAEAISSFNTKGT
jgi:hypothetical protein